jgi:threonine dehydratase
MEKPPDKNCICKAAARIKPYVHHTLVLTCRNLDELVGAEIFFKCENLQKAGAFKSRGAVNAVFSLGKDQMQRGVATHSSGNHAAALSRAAALRDMKAYIVMPENSSRVKVEAVRHYGGVITFCKPTLQDREDTLARVIGETGALEIHPYNDYRVIAGQATAAKELFEEVPALDVVMAPVGGGGLLSGTALSANYFSPSTRVIAAEPEGADDAFRSLKEGKILPSVNPHTVADGLLTSLGTRTFPIIREHVERIITVDDTTIIRAMKLIWERMKIVIEPSSAVPFAALLADSLDLRGKRIGIILSGGNVDLDKIHWLYTGKHE